MPECNGQPQDPCWDLRCAASITSATVPAGWRVLQVVINGFAEVPASLSVLATQVSLKKTANTYLKARTSIADGPLQNFERIGSLLLGSDLVKGTVDDLLGQALLALAHGEVHQQGN